LRLHVNPLNTRTVLVANEDSGSGEMKEKEEPMSMRDAALVSLILTVSQLFVSFLTIFTWEDIAADPAAFLYRFTVFMGGTFFGFFLVLSGLSRFASKNKG